MTGSAPDAPPVRSLLDDASDLLADARTWAEAELGYQKTRARFVADGVRRTLACAIAGILLALFALGGLTIGLIIALTPHLTAWGATALVVGVLLIAAVLAFVLAGRAWRDVSGALRETEPES